MTGIEKFPNTQLPNSSEDLRENLSINDLNILRAELEKATEKPNNLDRFLNELKEKEKREDVKIWLESLILKVYFFQDKDPYFYLDKDNKVTIVGEGKQSGYKEVLEKHFPNYGLKYHLANMHMSDSSSYTEKARKLLEDFPGISGREEKEKIEIIKKSNLTNLEKSFLISFLLDEEMFTGEKWPMNRYVIRLYEQRKNRNEASREGGENKEYKQNNNTPETTDEEEISPTINAPAIGLVVMNIPKKQQEYFRQKFIEGVPENPNMLDEAFNYLYIDPETKRPRKLEEFHRGTLERMLLNDFFFSGDKNVEVFVDKNNKIQIEGSEDDLGYMEKLEKQISANRFSANRLKYLIWYQATEEGGNMLKRIQDVQVKSEENRTAFEKSLLKTYNNHTKEFKWEEGGLYSDIYDQYKLDTERIEADIKKWAFDNLSFSDQLAEKIEKEWFRSAFGLILEKNPMAVFGGLLILGRAIFGKTEKMWNSPITWIGGLLMAGWLGIGRETVSGLLRGELWESDSSENTTNLNSNTNTNAGGNINSFSDLSNENIADIKKEDIEFVVDNSNFSGEIDPVPGDDNVHKNSFGILGSHEGELKKETYSNWKTWFETGAKWIIQKINSDKNLTVSHLSGMNVWDNMKLPEISSRAILAKIDWEINKDTSLSTIPNMVLLTAIAELSGFKGDISLSQENAIPEKVETWFNRDLWIDWVVDGILDFENNEKVCKQKIRDAISDMEDNKIQEINIAWGKNLEDTLKEINQ